MSDKTDIRAAAEEALRLHEAATPGEWVHSPPGVDEPHVSTRHNDGPVSWIASPRSVPSRRWHDAAFIARARTLLPILARAVIEGQTERDGMRAALTAIGFPRQDDESLTDTFERAWAYSVEMAHKAQASADAARAELASLRARPAPLTEAEAQALAEHIEFFRARVSGSTKRAIMGWFASRRTTTTEGT